MVRKKYDVAITELKTAVESSQDLSTSVRLGQVYNMAGKHDEAIAVLDKVMATADAPAQIKQIAQAEKARAVQAKGAKK
jgi:lipopolysaccharide biosynthesis regulator YciM